MQTVAGGGGGVEKKKKKKLRGAPIKDSPPRRVGRETRKEMAPNRSHPIPIHRFVVVFSCSYIFCFF